jgi:hypothetical protein
MKKRMKKVVSSRFIMFHWSFLSVFPWLPMVFTRMFCLILQPGLVLDSDIVVLQDPFQALHRDVGFEARKRECQ